MDQPQSYQVDVKRESTNQPWGFRLQGGIDFTTPLSIQSVAPGSPADASGLKPADAILQINGKATEGLEHDQAKREILMCTDCVNMVIQRNAVQIWRPKVTPVTQMRPDQLQQVQGAGAPDQEQYVQRTSLAANKAENNGDSGAQFNRSARPFAGFGGGAPAAAPAPQQPQQPQPAYQQQQPPQGGMYGGEQSGMQYAGQPQQQASPGGHGQPQYGAPPPQQQYGGAMASSSQQSQAFQPQAQPFAPPQPAAGGISGMRSIKAPTFDADHHAKMQEKHLQHHPDCKICGKSIVGVFVRIKGHPMHPECFKCIKCGLNLKQQGHFEVEGGLVCERCYD